jgi:ribosomal protein S18 acetylase RimI-like enzyme
MSLEIKLAYDDTVNIKELFSEYINLLLEVEKDFHIYLDLQNYNDEIENLGKKYGLPDGRLYIAYFDGQAAGCIALRQMSKTECEMKRLYIKPQFRKMKIGRTLVELIINDAKKIGYQYMFLDTLPSLEAALKLYEKFGFYRIPPYNDSPIDNTIFMKLDL